jgi:acyl-CoA dehydrogenase
MHFGLTDEQEMIVSTVRSFVENEIYPHEQEVERSGEVPQDVAKAIVTAQHVVLRNIVDRTAQA